MAEELLEPQQSPEPGLNTWGRRAWRVAVLLGGTALVAGTAWSVKGERPARGAGSSVQFYVLFVYKIITILKFILFIELFPYFHMIHMYFPVLLCVHFRFLAVPHHMASIDTYPASGIYTGFSISLFRIGNRFLGVCTSARIL